METDYWAECQACDTEVEVRVIDEEYEQPRHCPMCGLPCEFEPLEDEDEDDDYIDV